MSDKPEGYWNGIIAHLTFVGTGIAYFTNMEDRNEYVSFHIRQMIGLTLMIIVSNVTDNYLSSFIGHALGLITVACYFYSLAGAIMGKKFEIPAIGPIFQDIFKAA